MKYYIYDQFHWHDKDHLLRVVDGSFADAVEQYRFYKLAYPDLSLGLVSEKDYSIRNLKFLTYDEKLEEIVSTNQIKL